VEINLAIEEQYWCHIQISVPWRNAANWRDIKKWLIDNVSLSDYDFGDTDLNSDNRIILFAKEKDAILFALTWA